jgi:protein-L-isoaspartate O-methyltransferase
VTSIQQEERPARVELGRFLLETQAVTSDWAPAFAAVDRAAFLPDVMWPHDMDTGRSVAVSKTDDPAAWYADADANVPIVTQWDDGAHVGREPGDVSTSSASMPSVVFRMLGDLDVAPGQRALEVGTGTGYNAGLLAHRLGDGNVFTVEVDEAVAAQARDALSRAGLRPTVVEGDGLLGHPQGAPYDRVIATFGLRSIPQAWIEQATPGGLVVAPWGTHYTNRDAIVRLRIAEDGKTAEGHFTRLVEFMKARTQRLPFAGHAAYVPEDVTGSSDKSTTTLTQEAFPTGTFEHPGQFVVGLRVRDCWHSVAEKRDGVRPVWFYGLSDTSWAVVIFQDEQPEAPVYQAGPRRLWDEVETAWRWWDSQGQPDIDRFGLTVTAEGQRAWLDNSAQHWGL